MSEDEFLRDLEDLQAQLVTLKVGLGILMGALRAVGQIGTEQQTQILEAIATAASAAPTLKQDEWVRLATILSLASDAVVLESGRITFRTLH